ncbi:gamma-butyrobetaine hydroxylase-like domain-containing protein [Zhongshania marina]|uniref:1-(5-phosphoribosyl)-5-((5-phosphoribosylamino)methylideneamino)imidazole-4-carboxamide isomerase n=1 Tax=Zhongshania marina TaxID=2304603 RepID=A0A2S4HFJ2_9GAMM|nr:DUF971 domain-containing protein [Marortus luteolus]POP52747.1 1-(5-phosphoribosyl)-5-((5-phosphoribosylamino)methylideneamino)imidazole-4-carboxamide isomerase [Marortus luteolus]
MNQAPTDIKFRKQSQQLELSYASGEQFTLDSEFLRVHSPSAEVRGHGAGQETLQTGKLNVQITELIPVGNYALQLVFSDGHDSGIYSWTYLRELCEQRDALWKAYLQKLDDNKASRDPDEQVVKFFN